MFIRHGGAAGVQKKSEFRQQILKRACLEDSISFEAVGIPENGGVQESINHDRNGAVAAPGLSFLYGEEAPKD